MNALLNPSLLLGLLLSIGYAALFHLWTGRTLRDLSLYLLASLVGFGLGQWAGQSAGLSLFRIGQLYILETAVGAFLLLFIVRTLHPERSPS
jgi:uncharacterized membrane protein YeaQ/YmgE (transglycosylase-associated protein family)